MTRPRRIHDKDVRATEESMSRQTWAVIKKKKKRPPGFWALQLGIRAKVYELPRT